MCTVEIWMRGHLYKTEGWLEGLDAIADHFLCENLAPLNGAPELPVETLSSGEWQAVDDAFWEEALKEEHPEAYYWWEDHVGYRQLEDDIWVPKGDEMLAAHAEWRAYWL